MAATQMLAGFHAVIARLRQAPETIREVYVETQRKDKRMQSLIEQVSKAGRPVHLVGADRLDGLAGGSRHQGVVAVADARKLADDLLVIYCSFFLDDRNRYITKSTAVRIFSQ